MMNVNILSKNSQNLIYFLTKNEGGGVGEIIQIFICKIFYQLK